MTTPEQRMEGWERRRQRINAWLAYPLLAVSLLATVIVPPDRGGPLPWVVGLTVAAAGWSWFIHPPRPGGRRSAPAGTRLAGVQFVVLMGLSAALVLLSTWYGIFAFGNYYLAVFVLLAGRWRFVGIVVNAAVVALSYTAGLPDSGSEITTWLILFFLIAVVACVVSYFTWNASEQAVRHRQVIAELEQANRRLEAALEENAALHAQLLEQARGAGVQDERARMAREIHDTIAQSLAGIATQLEAADEADWRTRLSTARTLARDSLGEARRSVAGLQPRRLAEVRLPEAIAEMAREWSQRSGIPVTLETTGDPRTMIADVELALFRVAQESLANVAKHADASRVGLTLSYMDDSVALDVRDDGRGFDPAGGPVSTADDRSGYGLGGMRQRVQRVAGTLAIESAPGEGTAISATVPALFGDP